VVASSFDDGIVDLTRVLELDARHGETWQLRGNAYFLKGKALEREAERIDTEASLAGERGKSNKTAQIASEALVNKKYDERDEAFGKAIADFTRALAITPEDTWALAGRGEVLSHIDRLSEAYADFTRALALNPNDAYVLEKRGNVFFWMKNYEAALNDYAHALKISGFFNPDSFLSTALERVSVHHEIRSAMAGDRLCSIGVTPKTCSNRREKSSASRRRVNHTRRTREP